LNNVYIFWLRGHRKFAVRWPLHCRPIWHNCRQSALSAPQSNPEQIEENDVQRASPGAPQVAVKSRFAAVSQDPPSLNMACGSGCESGTASLEMLRHREVMLTSAWKL